MDACAAGGARLGGGEVGDGAAWCGTLIVGALAAGGAVLPDAWLRPVRGLLPASPIRHNRLDDDRNPGGG